jgi:hypothetical protein
MSHLEKLKQQLMVKPELKERQNVEVVIKAQEFEGNNSKIKETIIIDKTNQKFDRTKIIDNLRKKNALKVHNKGTIEFTKKKIETDYDKQPYPKPPVIMDEPKLKKQKKTKFVIEESDDEIEKNEKDDEPIKDIIPIKKGRITKKPLKGVAILGPENNILIGDTPLASRIHKPKDPINIKVSSYYMNNREIYVNFINSLFEPYKQELQRNKESITCDQIGKTTDNFQLLTHQQIVRDYMNLYTPYRGILLYHGLGSGKTATSIGITEAMKSSKKIIIMTPASLKANYVEELKKAGDEYYKKNQFWEWISIDNNEELKRTMSAILNLDQEYIGKQRGAWFVNIQKPSNYNELTDLEKKSLESQLDRMIENKYTFIKYNGLRTDKLSKLTSGFTKNIFDNSVVIIDEAHNLISRIVNKLKKEKEIKEDDRGEKEHLPINLSIKLYEYLMSASNARIVLLSGTPVINYANEFAILFNILRGYIKTWYFPLIIKTNNKIDRKSLQEMLITAEKSHDYLDYSPSSKILTITRNPYGFKNKIKTGNKYQGVSNIKKSDKEVTFENENISDEDFEKKIINVLKKNNIDVNFKGIRIRYRKALPDGFDAFYNRYIDPNTKELINVDSLKRRIIGLSSYFKSAQENLLPKYEKRLGLDYHVIRIPMSNEQFKIYESARAEERKSEKKKKKKKNTEEEEFNGTYKIFSRLFCNYALPNRPMPNDIEFKENLDSLDGPAKQNIADKIRQYVTKLFLQQKEDIINNIDDESENQKANLEIDKIINEKIDQQTEIVFNDFLKRIEKGKKSKTYKNKSKEDNDELKESESILKNLSKKEIEEGLEEHLLNIVIDESKADDNNDVVNLLDDAQRLESRKDMDIQNEGEIEGDEIMDEIGGESYKARIIDTIRYLKDNSDEYLSPEALQIYSPKFLHMLDNIKDPEYEGLHLVYSQFRTLEGLGIFSLVLEKNGFAEFKIKKTPAGVWEINIKEEDMGKPTFALYTGTESAEEKEIIRHIYNGEWDRIDKSQSIPLYKMANNNKMGEIIKVFMITSSGSEGINLKNTRYVHIMEPYWHPVRMEQVIGRARRICSHNELPERLQTVEVFVYLMVFTSEQLKSDEAIELKSHDLSRKLPSSPMTTDQNLYELSEIKANLNLQMTNAIKETSFDCYLHSSGKCVNFGTPTNDKFSYVPDYAEQQSDIISKVNKTKVIWVGKPISIEGVVYVYKRITPKLLQIYDKQSYDAAAIDSSKEPVQIGTLEVNEKGEQVFKQLVI